MDCFDLKVRRRTIYGDIVQNASEEELEELLLKFQNNIPDVIEAIHEKVRKLGKRFIYQQTEYGKINH